MIKYHLRNKDISKEVAKGSYILFTDKSKALALADEKELPCLTLFKTEFICSIETVTPIFAVKTKKK